MSRRLIAVGLVQDPVHGYHHDSVAKTVELRVADEANGHKLRGRQVVPKRLYPDTQRQAVGYQMERMFREAANILGQEWK